MMKAPCARVIQAGGRLVPVGSHAGKLVVIGSDHRGFALKERLKQLLRKRGWRVQDEGTHSSRRVDYPVFGVKVARRVGSSAGANAVGIGICDSSMGMLIVAGKIPGVLPANPGTVAAARITRAHNNTNFLSIAARKTTPARALALSEAWLHAAFYASPGRDNRYLKRYLQTRALEHGAKRRNR
jgi:ribose 5-phosphate isomerase B